MEVDEPRPCVRVSRPRVRRGRSAARRGQITPFPAHPRDVFHLGRSRNRGCRSVPGDRRGTSHNRAAPGDACCRVGVGGAGEGACSARAARPGRQPHRLGGRVDALDAHPVAHVARSRRAVATRPARSSTATCFRISRSTVRSLPRGGAAPGAATCSGNRPGSRFPSARLDQGVRHNVRFFILIGLLEAWWTLGDGHVHPGPADSHFDLGVLDLGGAADGRACTVGLARGQLVFGQWSDVAGRRRPLLIGLGMFLDRFGRLRDSASPCWRSAAAGFSRERAAPPGW